MSIPPLVCSTPPPPEQCEDDKDPEGFDMQYDLSQDDEEDFEYAHFPKPNDFHSPVSKYIENHQENFEIKNEINHGCIEKSEDLSNDFILHTTIEDSINIEDLNLEINDEYIAKNEESDVSTNNNIELSNNTIEFQNENVNDNIPNTSKIESLSSECFESPKIITCSTEKSEDVNEIPEEVCTKLESDQGEAVITIDSKFNDDINVSSLGNTEKTDLKYQDAEEDFDDFDSFQFTTAINEKVTIDTVDPWGNSNSEDVACSEFKADFADENLLVNPVCLPEGSSINIDDSETKLAINSFNEEIDDEFGDFDEFKCITEKTYDNNMEQTVSVHPAVPVFNLHSDNEHQLMESINKILQTIFTEEITAPEIEIKSNLEIFLGETWAHLKDIDIRRPYMVNWNTSLAQETLLKALCIDSRNILYGPKWNSSMPKYAANLSLGPLMPLKQTTQASSTQDQIEIEKFANKTSWQDPFTSDGQESCAVEKENVEMESGPTDIDVFEAAVTPKTDKIYSSTLNIQPIRQINLPDTHIFTPTDSETPRSKTIHYDSNTTHSVLIPQPVSVVKTQEDDFSSSPTTHTSLENDTDYWEFQDFKGSANINISPGHQKEKGEVNVETHKNPETFKSQVLKPIKLEPIIPTLNWPNPGEVKETFDDFADFISNVSSDDKQIPISQDRDFLSVKSQDKIQSEISSQHIDQLEDDFDTFQSALPLPALEAKICKSQEMTYDYDNFLSNIDPIKSDDISNITRPTENATESTGISSDVKELNFISAPLTKPVTNTNILQPTHISPYSSQHNEQKTGQILQPLSLESYSQINWPNPGIDLHDLSRFNPVESLSSLKSETSSHSKNSTPSHLRNPPNNQTADDDIWGEFKSNIPKPQQPTVNKPTTFVDDDEWTDFISSPSVPQNGLNTISYNVHANFNVHKSSNSSKLPIPSNDLPIDIPTLNYITPKAGNPKPYKERHFENL